MSESLIATTQFLSKSTNSTGWRQYTHINVAPGGFVGKTFPHKIREGSPFADTYFLSE